MVCRLLGGGGREGVVSFDKLSFTGSTYIEVFGHYLFYFLF